MMHQQQTKLLVGHGVNQLKTATGFPTTISAPKCATCLQTALRLNHSLNFFLDRKNVNITVSYLDLSI